MVDADLKPAYLDAARLPEWWPTDRHPPEFWESLGRTVATFGFLEETLFKAVFAIVGTKPVAPGNEQREIVAFRKLLERCLSDPLGPPISKFETALQQNPAAYRIDGLVQDLRDAAALRNALCHGSWRPPDDTGHCSLFYFNKSGEFFDQVISLEVLMGTQARIAGLIGDVMNSVTQMGYQFPGVVGPGKAILSSTQRSNS